MMADGDDFSQEEIVFQAQLMFGHGSWEHLSDAMKRFWMQQAVRVMCAERKASGP